MRPATGLLARLDVLPACLAVLVLCAAPAVAQEDVPGKFDYYQLVLSWSPTHCAENSRGPEDTQCGIRRKRPYAFIVHGLWPQYDGRDWPEFCRTRGRPYVPDAIINQMMDIMPSRGLIIHQFKKHGTCTGMNPETYFSATRIAYRNVKIPREFERPDRDLKMTTRELVNKFLAVNPTMTADAIQVICKRGNQNRLQEVKVCMSKKGQFRACQKGRPLLHRCDDKPMRVPRVRG
jgi:ribonuclease T2